jgi:hypothetical protein
MNDIVFDNQNARIHDDHNKNAIKSSLEELGTGRSVLVDSENMLIAGNGVYEQAQSLGLPVRVIESDGTELIAIKRTDLKTADDKRKALALADNKTSDLSVFSDEKVAELLAGMGSLVDATGFSDEEIETFERTDGILDDLLENNFQNSINADSDSFAVTLIFPKSKKEEIDKYIKEYGKEAVVEQIIKLCEGDA